MGACSNWRVPLGVLTAELIKSIELEMLSTKNLPSKPLTPEIYTSSPPPETMENSEEEQRRSEAMKKLKEVVFKLALTKFQSRPFAPERAIIAKNIADNLRSSLPSPLRIPNHPPYHEMIVEAIRGLNEKWGSSEESISYFIQSFHENLPWAHPRFLSYHLRNLVKSRVIVCTRGLRYALPGKMDGMVCPLRMVLPEEENWRPLLLTSGRGGSRKRKKAKRRRRKRGDYDEETDSTEDSWDEEDEEEEEWVRGQGLKRQSGNRSWDEEEERPRGRGAKRSSGGSWDEEEEEEEWARGQGRG